MRKKWSLSVLASFVLITGYSFAVSVKFTVDMKYQIIQGIFNSAKDKVYLRGSFNNWDLSNQMNNEGNGVYSVSINLPDNGWCEYKFYSDAQAFPNGGYEASVGISQNNRSMNYGDKDVQLAKLYFNNANMKLLKNSPHFEIYCEDIDVNYAEEISNYLEVNYPRITGALESNIGAKVRIWLYPDQKTYFVHKGYPNSPEWSVGGAVGKYDVLIFSPRYSFTLEGVKSTANHEFTHIAVAWKATSPVPSWLNEGAATFYSDDPAPRPIGSILYVVNTVLNGTKPTLAYIEQESFGDGNGYPLSFSIADFILTTHGSKPLANFIQHMDYSILGYKSKLEFQNAWHNFLDKYYLAPQVNVKFSVDMSYYVSKGWFNPNTDKVFIGGNFTNWYTFQTADEGNGVYYYSTTSPYSLEYQYKFKISSAGASNQGWEENVGAGVNGSRVAKTANVDLTLPAIPFNNMNNNLTIVSPNGDEAFIAGDSVYIKWKYTSIPNIRIEFSSNNGVIWNEIKSAYATSDCYLSWLVPNITTAAGKIRIVDVLNNSILDESDKAFRIVKNNNIGGPYLKDANTVLLMRFENDYANIGSPNNAGVMFKNANTFANWDIADLNKNLLIDNTSGGSCVKVPHYSELNLNGSWTIECWFYLNKVGSSYYAYPSLLIKDGNPSDYSIYFSSDGKTIHASYANTAGAVTRVSCGSIQPKIWYHAAFVRDAGKNKLSLFIRDTNRKIVASSTINDNGGTPKNTSGMLLIGGVSMGSNIQFDGMIDELRISNIARDFSSGEVNKPEIKLLSLSSGEKLFGSYKSTLTWNATGVAAVRLEYSADNGATWKLIQTEIEAAKGQYDWSVPSIQSLTCLLKVSSVADPSINSISAVFSINSIIVQSPNGGETWNAGSTQTIKWSAINFSKVRIAYSSNNGANWWIIADNLDASLGKYDWLVPDSPSNQCLIIVDSKSPANNDKSDASFVIDRQVGIEEEVLPTTFMLYQNYPNPFNPATTIKFSLPQSEFVDLRLFDASGKEVKSIVNKIMSVGYHTLKVNLSELSSGVYFYRLKAGSFESSKKLILMK